MDMNDCCYPYMIILEIHYSFLESKDRTTNQFCHIENFRTVQYKLLYLSDYVI